MRFKRARNKLIPTRALKSMYPAAGSGINLRKNTNINEAMRARIRLEPGPAKATHILPLRMLTFGLKFWGLKGTGLAHPKTGLPRMSRTRGRMTVPSGSMCGMGLRVRRPIYLAVGSPSL